MGASRRISWRDLAWGQAPTSGSSRRAERRRVVPAGLGSVPAVTGSEQLGSHALDLRAADAAFEPAHLVTAAGRRGPDHGCGHRRRLRPLQRDLRPRAADDRPLLRLRARERRTAPGPGRRRRVAPPSATPSVRPRTSGGCWTQWTRTFAPSAPSWSATSSRSDQPVSRFPCGPRSRRRDGPAHGDPA